MFGSLQRMIIYFKSRFDVITINFVVFPSTRLSVAPRRRKERRLYPRDWILAPPWSSPALSVGLQSPPTSHWTRPPLCCSLWGSVHQIQESNSVTWAGYRIEFTSQQNQPGSNLKRYDFSGLECGGWVAIEEKKEKKLMKIFFLGGCDPPAILSSTSTPWHPRATMSINNPRCKQAAPPPPPPPPPSRDSDQRGNGTDWLVAKRGTRYYTHCPSRLEGSNTMFYGRMDGQTDTVLI